MLGLQNIHQNWTGEGRKLIVRRIQICRSLQRFRVLETVKRRRTGRVVKASASGSLTVGLARD